GNFPAAAQHVRRGNAPHTIPANGAAMARPRNVQPADPAGFHWNAPDCGFRTPFRPIVYAPPTSGRKRRYYGNREKWTERYPEGRKARWQNPATQSSCCRAVSPPEMQMHPAPANAVTPVAPLSHG